MGASLGFTGLGEAIFAAAPSSHFTHTGANMTLIVEAIFLFASSISLACQHSDVKRSEKIIASSLEFWRQLVPTAEDGPASPQQGFCVVEAFPEQTEDGRYISFVARASSWSNNYPGGWNPSAKFLDRQFSFLDYAGPKSFDTEETPFEEITEYLCDFYFAVSSYNRQAYADKLLTKQRKSQLQALPSFSKVTA